MNPKVRSALVALYAVFIMQFTIGGFTTLSGAFWFMTQTDHVARGALYLPMAAFCFYVASVIIGRVRQTLDMPTY